MKQNFISNLQQDLQPKSLVRRFFTKLIILLVVIVIFAGAGYFYLNFKRYQTAQTKHSLSVRDSLIEKSNQQNGGLNVSVNHFKDTSLGFAFDYPKVWGGAIISDSSYDYTTKRISFTNPDYYYSPYVVQISTRESVVRFEKVEENCYGEGCYPKYFNTEVWDNEKKLLESNPNNGNIACVTGFEGALCEIKTFNKNKFLIRYYGWFAGDSAIDKSYIIYKNNIRYEITPPSIFGQGRDPSFLKSFDDQSTQKKYYDKYEDIVKSFTFL